MQELDQIDKKILNILQEDSSQSLQSISDKVGLSLSACSRRIKDYEDNGLIEKKVTILNPQKLEKRSEVFVEITLESQSEKLLGQFEAMVKDTDIISECYLMSGGFDYLIKLYVKDVEDYENIHRKILTRLPGVSRLTSMFALKTISKSTKIIL